MGLGDRKHVLQKKSVHSLHGFISQASSLSAPFTKHSLTVWSEDMLLSARD